MRYALPGLVAPFTSGQSHLKSRLPENRRQIGHGRDDSSRQALIGHQETLCGEESVPWTGAKRCHSERIA